MKVMQVSTEKYANYSTKSIMFKAIFTTQKKF